MPRVRLDGGVIGSLNIPSTTSASGMWTVKDNEEYTRRGLWPSQSYPVGSINATMLIVAGGAGGGGVINGSGASGGGGAGGLIYISNLPLTTTNYTITVGAGGAGGTNLGSNGTNGSNSSIIGGSAVSNTSIGGGGGGGVPTATVGNQGTAGGSGGGGGGSNVANTGGAGTSGQGFAGGAGISTGSYYPGGGGGGSANNGGNASTTVGGAGGIGTSYNFANGTSIYYAGGGGGGSYNGGTPGTGGSGGGANGVYNAVGLNGTSSTGGGGGGTGATGTLGNNPGGAGGSGIVIVSYPLPQRWSGGTVTNNNGANVIHTFTTSQTMTALASPIDTYQPYNTILLHADGTNGANNSVFIDSSTLNNTITRVGVPTQGTISPFATTGWSTYHPSASDYYSFPSLANMALGASGSCTIECWAYFNTLPVSGAYIFSKDGVAGTNVSEYSFQFTSSGVIQLGVGDATTSSGNQLINIGTVTTGSWYHIAACRSGSTWYLFLNGTLTNSGGTAQSASPVSGGRSFFIGGQQSGGGSLNGAYISNLRINIGQALYTSSFNIPIAALTNITNTVVLAAQNNKFIENISNGVITTAGTPQVQPFSPFNPTAAYSNTVVGGSIYLDGSSYLSSATYSNFAFGYNDFTIEFWVYPTSSFTSSTRFVSTYTNGLVIYPNTSGNILVDNYSVATKVTSSSTIPLNAWSHIAVTRKANTDFIYINGVSANSGAADATNYSSSGFFVGSDAGSAGKYTGYISNLRVTNGSIYSSNFTPSTAPPTAIANTTLLLNATNAGIIDSSQKKQLITYGSAAISNVKSQFGGSSLILNGSTDYLTFTNPIVMGTQAYTMECWFNLNSTSFSVFYPFIGTSTNSTSALNIRISNTTVIRVDANNSSGTDFTLPVTLTTGVWYHVAVTRDAAGNCNVWLNGVRSTSGNLVISTNYTGTTDTIGYVSSSNFFNGYIDEFRLTLGIARYTANFTPPTSAFLNT